MKRAQYHPLLTSILLSALILIISSCVKSEQKLIAEAEGLTWLSENFPPYNFGQTGTMSGVAVDILELVFNDVGINLSQSDIEMDDWANAYNKVQNEPGTVLFSMVKNDEREGKFKWVGPIAPHKEVIISQAGSGIKLNSDEDLNQYFIGVAQGYPSKDLLLNKGMDRGNIVEYESISALYEALINYDIQCISYSEQANNLILAGLGEDQEDYQVYYTIQVDQLYYAFNNSVSSGLIDVLQESLDKFSNDKEVDGSSTIEKILDRYSVILHEESDITDAMCIDLVNTTANDLEGNYNETVTRINNQEEPYLDGEITSLYSFVYDMNLTIVAHASNTNIVNKNFENKPDASGKLFRNEIREVALESGTGWVDYIYTKPDKSGLFQKTTYLKLITASNGQQYIVCSGKYK